MTEYVKPAFAVFLIVLVPGVIGGFMAANRGRKVAFWCLLCALFPPFLLFLHYSRPLCEVEGKFRRCQSCKEMIKWHEPVCKYCHSKQAGAPADVRQFRL